MKRFAMIAALVGAALLLSTATAQAHPWGRYYGYHYGPYYGANYYYSPYYGNYYAYPYRTYYYPRAYSGYYGYHSYYPSSVRTILDTTIPGTTTGDTPRFVSASVGSRERPDRKGA
jgi:hypothetical protein